MKTETLQVHDEQRPAPLFPPIPDDVSAEAKPEGRLIDHKRVNPHD